MKKKKSNNTPQDLKTVEILRNQLDRMETKIDKLDLRLDDAEKVAIKQEYNLQVHMKRSELLEQSQDDLKDMVKPIIKIYTVAWGISKIIIAASILMGIIGSILKISTE